MSHNSYLYLIVGFTSFIWPWTLNIRISNQTCTKDYQVPAPPQGTTYYRYYISRNITK
jgi:hypothetical protein